MIKNEVVVYKRENKWFIGTIKEDKLRKKKQVKKLADVTATDDYITLKKWIKDNSIKEDSNYFLEKFNVQSLYFKQLSTSHTKSALWSKLNPRCLKCQKECKQSYRVDIIACNYKENKGKV
jgi:hypothetical protein